MTQRAPGLSSSHPIVQFIDVQKSYDGGALVVKKLNLEVKRGEFLTLLGPSGSGKTTSLMMLAGFEAASAGEIFLDGKPINALPPHKRGIGVVFQNYALFPHMTVAENLAFPLQVRDYSKSDIEKRVREALTMVRLEGYESRRPAQLSGGQQQRIAVARALVFNPALILMDEPLGALDKHLREQMQYEIKSIHKTVGVSVVYVTHDQSEALTMSDRIAVFNDGRIMQLASPAELYEQPENAFVARFIGENNAVIGTIQTVDGDRCGVTVGNRTLQAKRVSPLSIGDSTTLSLRPERIVIGQDALALSNHIEGVVREVTYLGDHVRIRMSLLGLDNFVVKQPNAGRDTNIRWQAGETMPVGWQIDDCRALDCDGAPTSET
ncbi:ABC transporter ATP-binding protein [Sinorhizobium meliloti]|uniref:ABC transporter ATP-binding protein n=1 Tax=Rhizobium meliloti TaxID=382 RepID=UPI003D656A9F